MDDLIKQLVTLNSDLNKCRDEKRDLEIQLLKQKHETELMEQQYEKQIERLNKLLNPSLGSSSGRRW